MRRNSMYGLVFQLGLVVGYLILALDAKSQTVHKRSGDFLVYSVTKILSSDHFECDTLVVYLGNKENETYRKKIIDLFHNNPAALFSELNHKEKICIDDLSLVNLYYGGSFRDTLSMYFINTARNDKAKTSFERKGNCEYKGRNIRYEYKITLFSLNDICLLQHKVRKNVVGCPKLQLSSCGEVIFGNGAIISSEKEDTVYFPVTSYSCFR